MMADVLLEDRKGTILLIEVTAGAKSDLFPAGYNEWRNAIGCRVTAPAVHGKANKAVIGIIRLDHWGTVLCCLCHCRAYLISEKGED